MNRFFTKFDADGNQLWGTYYGTDSLDLHHESIMVITCDTMGNLYAGGAAYPEELYFGTPDTHQPYHSGGGKDGLIVKLDNTGNVVWGTYIGGDGTEDFNLGSTFSLYSGFPLALSPDESGVIVAGGTASTIGMPEECGYTDYVNKEGFMAFIKKNGTLAWGNYYDECISDVIAAPDGQGVSYSVIGVGKTTFNGLATEDSHQPNKDGFTSSVIMFKMNEEQCEDLDLPLTYSSPYLTAESGYSTYDWFHNDVFLTTTEENILSITDTSGHYYVKTFVGCCALTSDTLIFETTNIEHVQDWQPHIYPNPTEDFLYINLPENHQDFVIEIYNVLGQKVYDVKVLKNNLTHIVDINNFQKGLYFINIKSENKNWTSKFLVN